MKNNQQYKIIAAFTRRDNKEKEVLNNILIELKNLHDWFDIIPNDLFRVLIDEKKNILNSIIYS